jgi:hypothetical protein
VQPVTAGEWKQIVKMGAKMGAKTGAKMGAKA